MSYTIEGKEALSYDGAVVQIKGLIYRIYQPKNGDSCHRMTVWFSPDHDFLDDKLNVLEELKVVELYNRRKGKRPNPYGKVENGIRYNSPSDAPFVSNDGIVTLPWKNGTVDLDMEVPPASVEKAKQYMKTSNCLLMEGDGGKYPVYIDFMIRYKRFDHLGNKLAHPYFESTFVNAQTYVELNRL